MAETSVLIIIIMGISEVIKRIGFPVKFIPLINLVIGAVINAVYAGEDWRAGIFNGIIAGLSASGLYSGTKNVYQGIIPIGGSEDDSEGGGA